MIIVSSIKQTFARKGMGDDVESQQQKRSLFFVLICLAVILPLGVVFISDAELPSGDQSAHYLWLAKSCILAGVCLILSFVVIMKENANYCLTVYSIIIWSLILLGSVEAVWGICQIYGFTTSKHSLYSLTGSFFNPGGHIRAIWA